MTSEHRKPSPQPYGAGLTSPDRDSIFVGAAHLDKPDDRARLAAIARAEYSSRRRRDGLFEADIFAEPAWDMLLDLYVQSYEARSVSIHSLCIAAAVPQTTALRWIGRLDALGLIDRSPCPHDARVVYVVLSARGLALMERYLRGQLGEIAAIAGPLTSLR